MELSASERAVLNATAADLVRTTPVLAEFLAEGPERLRIRGIDPAAIDGLVSGGEPPSRRTRFWRKLRPGGTRD
jgi:hypothetical protein